MSSKKRPKSVLGTAAPGLSTCTVMLRDCAAAGTACAATTASAQVSLRRTDERLLLIRDVLISVHPLTIPSGLHCCYGRAAAAFDAPVMRLMNSTSSGM